MKFKGAEKQFWWHFRNITNTIHVPKELSGYCSIDSEDNDMHISFLVNRVKIIHSIFMKDTDLTDEGVQWIGQIQQLKSLTLMKHPTITKKSLPYLNQLTDLQFLDIWRTGILLEDLHELHQLKQLKEIYVSPTLEDDNGDFPEMDNDSILEKIIELEVIFPLCTFYVDHRKYS